MIKTFKNESERSRFVDSLKPVHSILMDSKVTGRGEAEVAFRKALEHRQGDRDGVMVVYKDCGYNDDGLYIFEKCKRVYFLKIA